MPTSHLPPFSVHDVLCWPGLLADFLGRNDPQAYDFQPCPPAMLPPPMHTLLVHDHGMTATLTGYWGEDMQLTVLDNRETGPSVRRHILLSGRDSGYVSELGLIDIQLDHLPAQAILAVRQRRLPFGAILQACGVAFTSQPTLFFSLKACQKLAQWLQCSAGQTLYGRSTCLYDGKNTLLATAVEILSPHAPRGAIPPHISAP